MLHPLLGDSVTLAVQCDASRTRRACLAWVCDSTDICEGQKGGLVHWSAGSLHCAISSSAPEIQALELGTNLAVRLVKWLLDEGWLVAQIIVFSDARTAIQQVVAGKDLPYPLARYVPAIRDRLDSMGGMSVLRHMPGTVIAANALTKQCMDSTMKNLVTMMGGHWPCPV